jgi:hypothetical protein
MLLNAIPSKRSAKTPAKLRQEIVNQNRFGTNIEIILSSTVNFMYLILSVRIYLGARQHM